jgi:hypothetical protein
MRRKLDRELSEGLGKDGEWIIGVRKELHPTGIIL